jgi:hypothetical protein
MSRGRRALELHDIPGWNEIVSKATTKVELMADAYGRGSRQHNEAAYELRRAERWRDEAVEEHERQHRDDGRDDREVAREVADRITRRW